MGHTHRSVHCWVQVGGASEVQSIGGEELPTTWITCYADTISSNCSQQEIRKKEGKKISPPQLVPNHPQLIAVSTFHSYIIELHIRGSPSSN